MAPLKTSVATSYDQNTKKVNDWKINDDLHVSVGDLGLIVLDRSFDQSFGFGGLGMVNSKYAHIEIVVTFLVVKIFGFLVITRDHGSYEGRH